MSPMSESVEETVHRGVDKGVKQSLRRYKPILHGHFLDIDEPRVSVPGSTELITYR